MISLYVLLVCIGWIPAPAKPAGNPNDIIVTASVEELANGYLDWDEHHPNALPAGKTRKIEMPTIDLYSAAGASIYFGANSATNAAFLRTLPQGMSTARTDAVRPSLKETVEMFPQLKAQEAELMSGKAYTIVAVTYPNWDHCREQNEAIAKLRERAAQSKVRIIEVRLHK
jgi:hypothetical protein